MSRILTSACLCAAVVLGAAVAAAAPLYHAKVIDLGDVFNNDFGYGNNPLSVAFDGTNAYVGGYNNSGATANVGVVKIENLLAPGTPVKTPLPATVFSSPNLRGLDALSYDTGTNSLIMMHDSGAAGTSFISRRSAADGSAVWTTMNPQGARPAAMAVDPKGDNGSSGVGFLVQGSGRRRLLSMASGATIFDGSNGGIINAVPTLPGTAWRAMAFDSDGNIAIGEDSGYAYGKRYLGDPANLYNRWTDLAGVVNQTARSVKKNVDLNNVGQGIVILEDAGSDLLAFSGRDATQLTDLLGGVTAVSDNQVHIRNLDGSVTGLVQTELTGDENGIGTPWGSTSDTKNLAYGKDASGRPVLLVLDFVERRLDVYVPEPTTAMLLGLPALLAIRRRRAGV